MSSDSFRPIRTAKIIVLFMAGWLCFGAGPDGLEGDKPGAYPDKLASKKDGMEILLVPAGPFAMGGVKNKNEEPRRQVELRAYYIDRTEVTYAQYLKFCESTGRQPPLPVILEKPFPKSRLSHPVDNVTWEDAASYCEWAGRRLPTEAEWEKACAGPEGQSYPWGEGWNGSICVNRTSSGDHSSAVGSKSGCKSPAGAMDMAGNVWEWTADWYKSYPGAPLGFDYTGKERVARGGAFFYSIDLLRCQSRHHLPPDDASDHGGFRCAVSAEEAMRD